MPVSSIKYRVGEARFRVGEAIVLLLRACRWQVLLVSALFDSATMMSDTMMFCGPKGAFFRHTNVMDGERVGVCAFHQKITILCR